MGIEKTELSLNKFDYKFEKINNKIIVKLDFAQRIIIDFSDPEKIKITDRLVGWNFLTGLIEMSLKNATLYNFIGAIIMFFVLGMIPGKAVAAGANGFARWRYDWPHVTIIRTLTVWRARPGITSAGWLRRLIGLGSARCFSRWRSWRLRLRR